MQDIKAKINLDLWIVDKTIMQHFQNVGQGKLQ
jgi:uncharacterized protein YkvS